MKTLNTILFFMLPIWAFSQVVPKTNMPGGGRDAGVCFTIGDKVYAGGGPGYKDFYEYNPATNAWTKKADQPGVKYSRAFGCGVAVGNKGYILLGGDSNNLILKNDVWEYDASSNTWQQLADFPGPVRDGSACFAAKGKIYIVGGNDNKNVFDDAYEYEIATNTWKRIANYPDGPINFPIGFTIGNYGYVTGGQGQSEFTSLYRYDATNDNWEPMANFTGTPRQAAMAFVINGMAYVGGGQKGYSQTFKDFYRYNPGNNSWAPAGDLGTKGRAWGMASVVNGKAYFGTGWDFGSAFFNDWYEFTPQTTSVTEIEGDGIKIYNDITTQQLLIELHEASIETYVRVSDISGREVYQTILGSTNATIDVSSFASGMYLLQVQHNNSLITQKFIVR